MPLRFDTIRHVIPLTENSFPQIVGMAVFRIGQGGGDHLSLAPGTPGDTPLEAMYGKELLEVESRLSEVGHLAELAAGDACCGS